MGSANTLPDRGAREPEVTFEGVGQPILDGTISVVFLGFGARLGFGPDVGPDVTFLGKGKPLNVGG